VLLALHVPYALALSIQVGVLDVIPLVGAPSAGHRRPSRPRRRLDHRSADHRGLPRAVPGVRGLPAQPPGAAQNRRRQPAGHHRRGPARRFTARRHQRPDRRPGRSRGTATAHRSAQPPTRHRQPTRHPAWATQSVALLRPWFIGTRSACATGPTSKPPPHHIDSRLPAAQVKRSQCRGRYSAAPTPYPKPQPTCTVRASARRCTRFQRSVPRTRGTEQRTVASSSTCRSGVCSVVDTRAQPNSCDALRAVPQTPDPARPRNMGSGPQLRYTAVTATCSETRRSRSRSGLLVGPAEKRDSGTVRPRGQSRDSGAVLAAGWILLRAWSSALVAALRGQPAGRSYPDLGLVGTSWDRDSPCATAAEGGGTVPRHLAQRRSVADRRLRRRTEHPPPEGSR